VTHYEWVQEGGDLAFGAPSDLLTFDYVPDHGIALKRVVARDFWVGGKNSGLDHTAVTPLFLKIEVLTGGDAFGGNTLRYSQVAAVPMTATGFFADAVDIYNVWWGGGGQDVGFDQEILAGSALDAFPTFVRVQVSIDDAGNPRGSGWNVGFSGVIKALFAYP
jgi:hypothetical protein